MAKRLVSTASTTLTAFADAGALTDALYPFLVQGGSATQRIDILEIEAGGLSTSSAPTILLLSRDSTVAVTNSNGAGQTDAAMDASTAALAAPPLTGNTNTTKPQRSATLHLLNLSFNAFGSLIRWVAPPITGGAPNVLGNIASLGEVSLSAFTGGGGGIVGAHCMYEPY